MSKEDSRLSLFKIQTCVLKVHIHCDGCKKKVKKFLQKIDGVYTVSIDSEHGKVTVSGSVDASTLIKKLSKAGKHAELISAPNTAENNKKKDDGKPQKGGGIKDQKQELEKLFKDLKLPAAPVAKDQKTVKFSLPEGFNEGSDFDDEFDDDEFDDDYHDEDFDDDDYDGDGEFDEEDDDILRPINMKPMSDKKDTSTGKKGGSEKKDNKKEGGGNGKNSKKKVEEKPKKMNQGAKIIQGMPKPTEGERAVQGMPAGEPMANHYNQQQHQQQQQQQMMMMMKNWPTVYRQPMGYMSVPPPVYGEHYTSMFSDENTNSSCSVM